MKQLNIDEIRKIQLDILKKVHSFCVKNNIKYFLGYGTLLGAVRHKGFIPWDDDIDIVMPRKDYEKFIREFNKEYKDTKVHAPELEKDYHYLMAKISNETTLLIEDVAYKTKIGVNIDLFPIDNYNIKDKLMYKKQIFYGYIKNIKIIKLSKRRNLLKNILLVIGKMLTFFISIKKIQSLMIKNAKKYKDKKTSHCCILITGKTANKPLLCEVFGEQMLCSFEGEKFFIPKYYDTWLKSLYGNYMKLPPEDKRISHHKFKAYKL